MTGSQVDERLPTFPSVTEDSDDAAVAARNGITRVPVDHYHVDGYRYTNFAVALAQVRRGTPARESGR